MKRCIPKTVAVLPAVVVAFALAGCGSKHERAKETTTDLSTAQVRVQTVENKSRTTTEEVVGTVQAKLRATLESKLSGRIENMPVVLGEKVQKGQLIARLDAGEIAARLEQAQASLEEAERDCKRTSALFEQQSATLADYDSAQARQQIAQGALAEAKAMMGYVEILSPFDGVVTKKWANVGDLATPGKPLVEMEDPSQLRLQADVPDVIAAHVHQGARMAVEVDALKKELIGTVVEISPVADPVTHTFGVKVDLPSTPGLMSGQFARLEAPVGESQALLVPESAVVARGQLEVLFVVADRHAQLRLVKTGRNTDGKVEILSGLDAGDSVVIDGASQLTDGQPVEAK